MHGGARRPWTGTQGTRKLAVPRPPDDRGHSTVSKQAARGMHGRGGSKVVPSGRLRRRFAGLHTPRTMGGIRQPHGATTTAHVSHQSTQGRDAPVQAAGEGHGVVLPADWTEGHDAVKEPWTLGPADLRRDSIWPAARRGWADERHGTASFRGPGTAHSPGRTRSEHESAAPACSEVSGCLGEGS